MLHQWKGHPVLLVSICKTMKTNWQKAREDSLDSSVSSYLI